MVQRARDRRRQVSVTVLATLFDATFDPAISCKGPIHASTRTRTTGLEATNDRRSGSKGMDKHEEGAGWAGQNCVVSLRKIALQQEYVAVKISRSSLNSCVRLLRKSCVRSTPNSRSNTRCCPPPKWMCWDNTKNSSRMALTDGRP